MGGRRGLVLVLVAALAGLAVPAPPAAGDPSTDDPCYSTPNVNTGTLLNQSCKSWICEASVTGPTESNTCGVPVSPAGPGLYFEVLWMTGIMMTSWSLEFRALDYSTGNWTYCPLWSGVGPPEIGSLAPCTLAGTGPWLTSMDFMAPPMQTTNPSTWNRGSIGAQIGRDIV